MKTDLLASTAGNVKTALGQQGLHTLRALSALHLRCAAPTGWGQAGAGASALRVLCRLWPARPGLCSRGRVGRMEGLAFPSRRGSLLSVSFDQLTSHFVVPRGFSPRW